MARTNEEELTSYQDIRTNQAIQAEVVDAEPKARRLRMPSKSTVVAVVVLVAGLGIIAYPTFSDWWNSYHQSRVITDYVKAVEETDQATIDRMFAEARAYNEQLAKNDNRWHLSEAELEQYKKTLALTENGVMGYVQVPSINVDYPIYHGMDESTLQVAIGHLEGTSLPVGGETTHAAISGHRGLPSARLFTDLDKVVEGDYFSITVLDQAMWYEVDQIRIVLPEDLANLAIEEGQDYVTLITCTPYGINTHRMLVRGHRVDAPEGMDSMAAEAQQIPRYIAITAVAVPILFAFLVGMLIYYRVRRPEADLEVAAEVLREQVRNSDGSGFGMPGRQ